MTLVYEIYVNCTNTSDYLKIRNRNLQEQEPYISYYPSVLKIYKKLDRYEVWVTIRELTLFCQVFKTLREAELYVNKSMKLVMWGMFVYKHCFVCSKKVYYPEAFCNDCHVVVYPVFSGWSVEKENEKISQHLSFSRPSWKPVALRV